jgi:predicted signal transduction protein with EAL and GGDEF domain
VGVAVFPDHAPDAEGLLARADSALRSAIAAGSDTWRIVGEQDLRPGSPGTEALVARATRTDASADITIERG